VIKRRQNLPPNSLWPLISQRQINKLKAKKQESQRALLGYLKTICKQPKYKKANSQG
jgi:hypothetical protein